eukprot:4528004-Amphidinium_carterae.1
MLGLESFARNTHVKQRTGCAFAVGHLTSSDKPVIWDAASTLSKSSRILEMSVPSAQVSTRTSR